MSYPARGPAFAGIDGKAIAVRRRQHCAWIALYRSEAIA